jgi:predicted nucleotidyltransferase
MFVALLEKTAAALDRAGIPYMVIGGQAVLRHGEPRLTRDIDLTLGVDVDRLADVLAVTVACGYELLVDPEPFVRQTMVLPCRDPKSGVRLDLVFSFSPYEREAIARAEPVRLGSADVRFATVEDLVIHKMIAGRPRDLEDVRGLLLRNPGVDRAAVEEKLSEFGEAAAEPILGRFRGICRDLDS